MTKFFPNQLINAGNFQVSISKDGLRSVAVFSKFTGDFVKLSTKSRSKRLRKIHRLFKDQIIDFDRFVFGWMTEEKVEQLISILK